MSAPLKRKNSSISSDTNGEMCKDGAAHPENAEKKSKSDLLSASCHPDWNTLDAFKFVKILKDDAQTKTLCIHAVVKKKNDDKNQATTTKDQSQSNASGGDGDSTDASSTDEEVEDAVIVMERSAFDTSDLNVVKLLSGETTIKQIFNNDIYGTYQSLPPSDLNSVKTVIIYPATAKHLEKYQRHDGSIISESADDYQNITLPYIQSSHFDMQWIYNILEKKKESEFIIYEDPDPINGYILLPDLKWDRKSLDNMYLSAIIHRNGIRSIRDLTTEHLPLLKNMQTTALKAIEEKYGVSGSRIRAYFHYQPSYFHLHVHFNQIKYTAPGSNVLGAHLLSDVISNIELKPDYYQKKTLSFVVQENALLYKCYADAGRVGKV